VYYYQLGERLGIDRLAEMCRRFKLGDAMGIGLAGEKKGLIPTTEWKLKRFGKRWVPGDTPPAAIGQGYVLMTPIQMVSMMATVANEGTVFRPHLVKQVVDADGKVLKELSPEVLAHVAASSANFKKVKQGLYAVVNDAGGTGAAAQLGDVRVAGKTGTSQVVKLGEDRKRRLAYEYQDHALFTAFAPYDKPEIAVAVVVEHGGGGGAVAAPIAGQILRVWFDLKKPAAPRQAPAEDTRTEVQPAAAVLTSEPREQHADEE
jgi:penicillin-binding protein 2